MSNDRPVLSICIPTYNRAKYLDNLLKRLSIDLPKLTFETEIIISNNCSDDHTDDIVAPWLEKLPLRYFKQDKNLGARGNGDFVYAKAQGVYTMYLGDDDLIDVDGLNAAIDLLMKTPDASVLYAPWTLYNRAQAEKNGQFYYQPNTEIFEPGDYHEMLSLILSHHIFPEISIFKTDLFRELRPVPSDLAYWAFTIPAEWLSVGKVIFSHIPFYLSVTEYFAGETRHQAGHEEATHAWDRYRGGLEHLLGLAKAQISEDDYKTLQHAINEFIATRMLIAFKLSLANDRDPIEMYDIASRIRGLGKFSELPIPYDVVRLRAIFWFITHEAEILRDKTGFALIGQFSPSLIDFIKSYTDLPVEVCDSFEDRFENTILFFSGLLLDQVPDRTMALSKGNLILTETVMLGKFP